MRCVWKAKLNRERERDKEKERLRRTICVLCRIVVLDLL